MPAPDETLAVLKTLASAYPDKALTKDTLQLYVDSLADIPASLLQRAAQEHIGRSAWFPRISELRLPSARLAGVRTFDTLPDLRIDPLYAEELALQAAFARGDDLDESAWRALADRYDRLGRHEMASRTRRRLDHYLSIQ